MLPAAGLNFTVIWPQGIHNPVDQSLPFTSSFDGILKSVIGGLKVSVKFRVHQVKLNDFVTPNSCWVLIFTDQFTHVTIRSEAECSFHRFHTSPDHLFTSFGDGLFFRISFGSTLPQVVVECLTGKEPLLRTWCINPVLIRALYPAGVAFQFPMYFSFCLGSKGSMVAPTC